MCVATKARVSKTGCSNLCKPAQCHQGIEVFGAWKKRSAGALASCPQHERASHSLNCVKQSFETAFIFP